ncbi:MAG TPA: hypothetical protein VFJ14_12505 [Nocardioidaceae bacterium]|nr:hypothetical protein [Nocardioidaceae bacterium]
MDLIAYLGTVAALCGLAVAGMQAIVRQLGHRIDDLHGRFDDVNARFDDVNARFDTVDRRFEQADHRFAAIEVRLTRLETQSDSIIAAMADLGQRVNLLERPGR